jgi:predicted alpha/beta-fold hydrolase
MNRSSELTYTPAWWVPGAHAQTIWGKFARGKLTVTTRVERWETPDSDFVELHRLDETTPDSSAPRLLLLHGLEGTINSHYLRGTLDLARRANWPADVLLFRGCGSEINRARRIYHSGETSDLDFVVRRLIDAESRRPLVIAGFSLGGNVLLKWLGESGAAVPSQVRGAAAISVPFDLERGCRHIERGFARIYNRHFLRTLRRKAAAKLRQYPDLFHAQELAKARTLYEFDDVVTAPVHGFKDAHDYYTRSSSIRFLNGIRVPTLLVSSYDDPFLPPEVLDSVAIMCRSNACLTCEFSRKGGHVGFVSGRIPFRSQYYAERRLIEFLRQTAPP